MEPAVPGKSHPLTYYYAPHSFLAQLPQLVKGLKLLSQADPAVEAFQQQNGEYVIMAAGELHLEVCKLHTA